VILGIDLEEDRNAVRKFVQQNQCKYPVLIAAAGDPAIGRYRAHALPTLVVVDKNGLIADYDADASGATEASLRRNILRVSSPEYVPPKPVQDAPTEPAVAALAEPPPQSPAAKPNPESEPDVFTPGADVSAPIPVYKPEPPYTAAAKNAKVSGALRFAIVIDAQGNVQEAKELSPRLGKGLDESAEDTIRTWKFKPSLRAGVAVPVRVTVHVNFDLF
jgi:TonB family protein